MRNATLSECTTLAVLPLRSHLECEPVVHDPRRDVYVPDMPGEDEGAPAGFEELTGLEVKARVPEEFERVWRELKEE